MTIAEALMDYVIALRWNDLPGAVIEESQARTLDLLGIMLTARADPAARAVISHVSRQNVGGPCTIVGTSRRTDPSSAALANGVLAHCLELDDEHHASLAHLGAVVVPACLAVTEAAGRSGRDFLLAVVAGYDIMGKVGSAVAPGVLHERGFHPTGLYGTFAAAGTAARLLGLDLRRAVSALGIAGSLTSSIFEFVADGSLTKRLHPGWAAHSGITAAYLAEAGLTGPASVFEGRHGFFHAFAGEGMYDCSRITDGLGENFAIRQTAYKPYACCSYIHPAIDAVLGLCRAQRLSPEEIGTLEVYVHPATLHIIADPEERKRRPQTAVDAQFSVYFAISAALLAEPVDQMETYAEWFQGKRLSHPAVLALAERVRCLGDPVFDADFPTRYPARAVVTTRDGRQLSRSVRTHRGDPIDDDARFSWHHVEERFRRITGSALTPEHQDSIVAHVRNLITAPSLSHLAAVLHLASPPTHDTRG